ncbi:Sugar phosphate isomerase/epimerase [Abditibacterium utsteinense]|uniref:Sugar phosphate isomerase/epimerase n=1 Tax=Abditibacterium utsteinense TaxID=1960156 RepID=A0A2S8SRC8_9BACT|nr:sugar phosphate isomerase/epimerase [Abditibacterium utsteinense]PQV63350.1 Sugar phosphate isomerase/epimerase [Abditibacterium utsteinense]
MNQTPFQTRTGNFPIGFRRGWSDWQKSLPALLSFAQENGFSVIDLGKNLEDLKAAQDAGLRIGSVDLLQWQPMFSSDAAKRADAIAKNAEYIAAAGAQNFFIVVLPEDPKKTRLENFGYVVEAFNGIAPALEKAGGKLVIEGWPGDGALCCTPETFRAAFREAPSNSIGINYDPSHFLRMGIDPIRFLKEFASRVHHVHGKDAIVLSDDLYEYGWEQPATFKKSPDFGAAAWRYTIPGQGNSNWTEITRILSENGYQGAISIELEDQNYNGSEEGEKRGLIAAAQLLSAC